MFEDARAICRNDPAAKRSEVVLYPSLQSVAVHRHVSHRLHRWGVPFLPRLISQIMRFLTGIEIHPGAKIGSGLFIDHGMGTVIGETAEIGKGCVMYHNVTLGGTGKHRGKRHPTIGDNVLIGTGTTILGPVTVGNGAKIGAGTFIINCDVPSRATVVGTPGRIVRLNGKKVNIKLKRCARA
jgi:serine O-acetyltransferase